MYMTREQQTETTTIAFRPESTQIEKVESFCDHYLADFPNRSKHLDDLRELTKSVSDSRMRLNQIREELQVLRRQLTAGCQRDRECLDETRATLRKLIEEMSPAVQVVE